MTTIRGVAGGATALVAVAVILAVTSGPAAAHVKVDADSPAAGATDVEVTFTAEAESKTAGIQSLRTVLPDGISPRDVSLVSGPKGWHLKATSDGYVISGIALPQGDDVSYVVKVAKLPTGAKSLAFKTVERYGDGEVDRWDDPTKSVAKEEDNAAPVIELKAAVAPAGKRVAPAAQRVAAGTASSSTSTGGLSSTAIGAIILVILGVVGGVFLWIRTRIRPATHHRS
jgi:hypothetical protein